MEHEIIYLTPQELLNLRLELNITYEQADAVFHLKSGSYKKYEKALVSITDSDDYLIRQISIMENGELILKIFFESQINEPYKCTKCDI